MDTEPDRPPRHLDELFERLGVAPDTVKSDLDQRMVLTAHAPSNPLLPAAAAIRPQLVLGRELGRGGMGLVVLAEQTALRREVAVKRLRPDVGGEPAMSALLHEALITGALEHPNIVPIYQLEIRENGAPLIVMKRIEGVPWSLVRWSERLYLAHGIGMLALVGVVLLVFWPGLTQNQANRQVLYTLVGTGIIGLLFRGLVVVTGQPLRVSFAFEYLFWGLGMCVISMFGERRLLLAGLCLFAGATAGALWPAGVLFTSFLATATAMSWTAWVWWPRSAGRERSHQ